MTDDSIFNNFYNDLNSLDIAIVPGFDDEYYTSLSNITEEMVKKQLTVIYEFHKRMGMYDGFMKKRFGNKTGKIVEEYKINNKKLKRDLKNIIAQDPKNSFEGFLIEIGGDYAKRADMCIDKILSFGYMDVLLRSMKKCEICLGNTDFSNLRMNGQIEIVNLDGCCYNLEEVDAASLLSKLKRKNYNLNWKSLVEYYCGLENLDKRSENYIIQLISYPYEFMKCCNRYRERKKLWSPEEYKLKLKKAMEKDGDVVDI